MSDTRYSLDELSQLLDMSPRTIRYYIQEALVDRPEGQKRGAYYLDSHLKQLKQIKDWQREGYSLDRIRQLLESGETSGDTLLQLLPQRGDVNVWSRVHIATGIELHINPQQAGLTPGQTRELYRQIGELVDKLPEE